VPIRRQPASKPASAPAAATGPSLAPEAAAILAALSGPVLLLDAEARWRAASPAAERLLQLHPEPEGPGRLPAWIGRSPELLACLRARHAAELWLTAAPEPRRWRLQLTPLALPAGFTLLEFFDQSREAALRGQVLSMHHAQDDLQAAHEELLCAYEILEANQERDHLARAIQEEENQNLQKSNLKLRRALGRARPSARRPRED
jgi:hypothetical protein